jgi:S1-C subfamily serine protease
VVRPVVGVRYVLITPAIQSALRLPTHEGALLVPGEGPEELAVIPGSAADKAGLQEGDMILEVDGQKVTPDRSLQSLIRAKRPGDTVTLTVLSRGNRKTVSVTLEEAR